MVVTQDEERRKYEERRKQEEEEQKRYLEQLRREEERQQAEQKARQQAYEEEVRRQQEKQRQEERRRLELEAQRRRPTVPVASSEDVLRWVDWSSCGGAINVIAWRVGNKTGKRKRDVTDWKRNDADSMILKKDVGWRRVGGLRKKEDSGRSNNSNA